MDDQNVHFNEQGLPMNDAQVYDILATQCPSQLAPTTRVPFVDLLNEAALPAATTEAAKLSTTVPFAQSSSAGGSFQLPFPTDLALFPAPAPCALPVAPSTPLPIVQNAGPIPRHTQVPAQAVTQRPDAHDAPSRAAGRQAQNKPQPDTDGHEEPGHESSVEGSDDDDDQSNSGDFADGTEGAEDEEETANSKGRTAYTGQDYIQLARAVADVNPYSLPYKQRGPGWQRVLSKLQARGRFKKAKVGFIQGKIKKLVAEHKDESTHLGRTIASYDESLSSSLAGVLECIANHMDEAKQQSDEQKAKSRKKDDEDREGGEAIRSASMKALQQKRTQKKRAHTESGSDSDSSSAGKSDSEDDVESTKSNRDHRRSGRQAKRRRSEKTAVVDNHLQDIKTILRESDKRQAEDSRAATRALLTEYREMVQAVKDLAKAAQRDHDD